MNGEISEKVLKDRQAVGGTRNIMKGKNAHFQVRQRLLQGMVQPTLMYGNETLISDSSLMEKLCRE